MLLSYEHWRRDQGLGGYQEFRDIFLQWKVHCRALLKDPCGTDGFPKLRIWDVSYLEKWLGFVICPWGNCVGMSRQICGRSRDRRERFDDCEIIRVWCRKFWVIENVGSIFIEKLGRNNRALQDSTLQPPQPRGKILEGAVRRSASNVCTQPAYYVIALTSRIEYLYHLFMVNDS